MFLVIVVIVLCQGMLSRRFPSSDHGVLRVVSIGSLLETGKCEAFDCIELHGLNAKCLKKLLELTIFLAVLPG